MHAVKTYDSLTAPTQLCDEVENLLPAWLRCIQRLEWSGWNKFSNTCSRDNKAKSVKVHGAARGEGKDTGDEAVGQLCEQVNHDESVICQTSAQEPNTNKRSAYGIWALACTLAADHEPSTRC